MKLNLSYWSKDRIDAADLDRRKTARLGTLRALRDEVSAKSAALRDAADRYNLAILLHHLNGRRAAAPMSDPERRAAFHAYLNTEVLDAVRRDGAVADALVARATAIAANLSGAEPAEAARHVRVVLNDLVEFALRHAGAAAGVEALVDRYLDALERAGAPSLAALVGATAAFAEYMDRRGLEPDRRTERMVAYVLGNVPTDLTDEDAFVEYAQALSFFVPRCTKQAEGEVSRLLRLFDGVATRNVAVVNDSRVLNATMRVCNAFPDLAAGPASAVFAANHRKGRRRREHEESLDHKRRRMLELERTLAQLEQAELAELGLLAEDEYVYESDFDEDA